jgi:hypothetical protein
MDQTLEVRWFYDGMPPDAVVSWFESLNPHQQSEREDLYLISNDPSLNVKLREGKIQLKRHSGGRTRTAFSSAVRGVREYWQKWSFPLTADAPDLFTDDPSGLWMPVTKSRMQRVYEPDEQRALLDTLDEPNPAKALVELTRVTQGEHTAWTICMEAEGQAEALEGTLRQMGCYVFNQDTPPDLAPAHSFGYVRWLERLEAHAAGVPTNGLPAT